MYNLEELTIFEEKLAELKHDAISYS